MFANIGPWQLLIILVIVLAIFGTKKLSTLGSDLGKSVKGFRSAMNEAEETADQLSDSSSDADSDADFDNTPAEEEREKTDS
jgi:sec-independent protein translocase protein TatA